MKQSQSQQQQQPLHRAFLSVIERLSDPRCSREERQNLRVYSYNKPPIDRGSWQHLVDFVENRHGYGEQVMITELELLCVKLITDPSDGGLTGLREFFAKSHKTTLTKVTLNECEFGTEQDASQLFASFHTNRTVVDLTIHSLSG
jgi:hypothetical protein